MRFAWVCKLGLAMGGEGVLTCSIRIAPLGQILKGYIRVAMEAYDIYRGAI